MLFPTICIAKEWRGMRLPPRRVQTSGKECHFNKFLHYFPRDLSSLFPPPYFRKSNFLAHFWTPSNFFCRIIATSLFEVKVIDCVLKVWWNTVVPRALSCFQLARRWERTTFRKRGRTTDHIKIKKKVRHPSWKASLDTYKAHNCLWPTYYFLNPLYDIPNLRILDHGILCIAIVGCHCCCCILGRHVKPRARLFICICKQIVLLLLHQLFSSSDILRGKQELRMEQGLPIAVFVNSNWVKDESSWRWSETETCN